MLKKYLIYCGVLHQKMNEASLKMQTRALLVSILKKYSRSVRVKNSDIQKDIATINCLKDKDYVAKMLFSEIPQTRCSYANICAIFLLNAVDKDVFEKHALNFLADKNSSDEKKFFIISLLKQKGIGVDYDSLSEYIENPEQLAKNGVKDFLKNAICDPEVQIDLLDFYLNIADEEKIYLIRNLIADYEGDNLSNALSLLSNLNLNKEETKLISEGLCSTSSYFALEGLKNLLNSSFVTQKLISNFLAPRKIRLLLTAGFFNLL